MSSQNMNNLFKLYVSRKLGLKMQVFSICLFSKYMCYNLVTQDRYASAHGGLALYIHKNWSYTVKPCENKSLYWEETFVTLGDPLASNPTKICIGNF